MNLPSGPIIQQGLSLSSLDFKNKLKELMQEQFSGFIALMIEGFDGAEEGVLFFKKGLIIASAFEYLKFDVAVIGDFALAQCLNAAGAEFGVLDIVSLTTLQVDMAIAFDEKLKLSKPVDRKDLEKLSISAFETSFAEKTLAEAIKGRKEGGKEEVFKRFGLSRIVK